MATRRQANIATNRAQLAQAFERFEAEQQSGAFVARPGKDRHKHAADHFSGLLLKSGARVLA